MSTVDLIREIEEAVQNQDHQRVREIIRHLDHSYKRCHALLNEAYDAILIFHPETGRILECNPRTKDLFLRGQEELQSLTVADLHPAEHRERVQNEFFRKCSERKNFFLSLPAARGNGSLFHVEASFSHIELRDGLIVQGIYRDVTERVRLCQEASARNRELEEKNKQLEESQRLRTEFIATISHELRTPLNAIIGYNSLLSDGIYGDLVPPQRKAVDRIDRNATRLLTLINQLLDLSRLEAGAVAVFHERVDLVKLVREVLDDYQGIADEKGISLELSHPNRGAEAVTDGGKFREIVRQLVSNSLKFTNEGHVRIALRPGENSIVAEVSDSGSGIGEDMKKDIFELFRQGDASYTRRHEGAGLGLAIVQRLTDLLGIGIEVESEEGRGALFRLKLPVHEANAPEMEEPRAGGNGEEEPSAPDSEKPAASESQYAGSAKKALIVDDDPYTVEILTQILETKAHFKVEKAFSGMHAMIHLAKEKPDFLLVDLLMPQINGERVIQYCHELWKDGVQVIVITGKSLDPQEERRLLRHAKAVIRKGDLRPATIAKTLENVIPLPESAAV